MSKYYTNEYLSRAAIHAEEVNAGTGRLSRIVDRGEAVACAI